MRFEGVFVALATAFSESRELDLSALESHLSFLLTTPISGFVPVATTGEAPTISESEREAILKMVVEMSAGSKTVIAGCGSNSTLSALKNIEHAAKLGCDATLIVTPYYNRPTRTGVIAHYLYLAEKSPLPIIAYGVPSRTNVPLTPDMIVELFQHPNIVGVKDASGSHADWLKLSTLLTQKDKFWLAGDDDAFATLLALGGHGIISTTANLAASHFCQLYDAAKAGDLIRSFEKQKKLLPLIQAMFAETNPAPLKYALHEIKRMKNVLRLPLVSVNAETQKKIDEALRTLELLP